MSSYLNQLKTIKRLKVKEGHTERFNCPFCNGYNTLGVSVINGILNWHCFKASCNAHGVYEDGLSIEGIKGKLTNIEGNVSMGREIPFLTTVRHDETAIRYLVKVNCIKALDEGLVDIQYAPTEHRVMFGVGKKNYKSLGYSGRRLGLYGPKWLKYGDTSSLFTCGNGKIGVLVEDAPSACAVGILEQYTGISLLGTNLTKLHKSQILNSFDSILICLDPDAAKKSLTLAQSLEGFIKTSVKLIPDDLKLYNETQIQSILTKDI